MTLSTILLRLWIALTTAPSGFHLLLSWVLLGSYAAIAAPLSLRWRFANLEPVQIWWSLHLHRYGLALRHNRRAALLMVMLAVAIALEELVFRVALIPLAIENRHWSWLALGWLLAVVRYPLLYGWLHPALACSRLLWLAAGLEAVCISIYFATQSFWLTVIIHWLVVVVWLFPLGGRYQLWQWRR